MRRYNPIPKTRRYYKVTGKVLREFLIDWSARRAAAMQALYRFSRRVGGDRDKVGITAGAGWESFAVFFKDPETVNRDIWKKASRYSDEFWVPKASGKAGKTIRKEFGELVKAIPSLQEINEYIGLNPFGGNDLIWYSASCRCHGEVWTISLPEYYEPPRGLGLRRMSDVAFEKLVAGHD